MYVKPSQQFSLLLSVMLCGLLFASCGDTSAKYSALASKIKTGDMVALKTAVTALQSAQNPVERAAAARALKSQANRTEVRKALMAQYKIDDDTVRPAILEALYFKPAKEIFPMMRRTFHSKKTSEKEKIICIRGFARSNIKAAHGLLNRAIWSRRTLVDLGPTADDSSKEVSWDEKRLTYVRYDFQTDALQMAAVQAAGANKVRSSEAYLTGVLRKNRAGNAETVVRVIEAIVAYGHEKSMNIAVEYLSKKLGRLGESKYHARLAAALSRAGGKAKAPASVVLARLYFETKDGGGRKTIIAHLKGMGIKGGFARCKPEVLRVRDLPSIRGKRIGKCERGQVFSVTNKGKLQQNIDKQTDFWYEIQFTNSKKGWVFGHYIEKLNF